MEFVGRFVEEQIMEGLLSSPEAEMLAIIGRRRVGKTFLIREVYKNEICFELTGIKNATKAEQLLNFSIQLKKSFNIGIESATPDNWIVAFEQLSTVLQKKRGKKKKVIFFDELPWLGARRSGFLEALAHFWNTWAVKQNIIVVVCGSAASWMFDKVVSNKGGLHNRITKLIELEPFSLAETEAFFKAKKVKLNRYQIVQLYMVMGGIPHYLKEIVPGESAVQNINNICFGKHGLLKNEFGNLYAALFEKADKHEKIVRALASKWKGLTRAEIVSLTGFADGGSLTRYLNELVLSGFVSQYHPLGKLKKETLFRLTDEFSLFHLKFIEKKRIRNFEETYQQSLFKNWSGYAFESLCIKHIEQVKVKLGIAGVTTQESSFFQKGNDEREGFQIDMLIDRKDGNMNICEMKYYDAEFSIDANYARKLRQRVANFRENSKTKKHLFLTFISPFGVKKNQHSLGLIDHDITIDALFEK